MGRQNSLQKKRFGLFIIFILVLSVGLDGCVGLRHKFTRKHKKKESEQEVPVLEPVEYVPPEQSPRAMYEKYYGLWRVWTDEIMYDTIHQQNQKRMGYILGKAIDALHELSATLKPDYQEKLQAYIEKFENIKTMLEDPAQNRDFASLKVQLGSTVRRFRREFRPENFFEEEE